MSDSDVDDDAELDAEVERHANERKIILDFLSGRLTRKPNIFLEDIARIRLAEYLRHGGLPVGVGKRARASFFDPQIMWRLAALFEPDSSHTRRGKNGRVTIPPPPSDWMLFIQPRPLGGKVPRRLSERSRDKEIARMVAYWRHRKKQMKWIVEEIKRRYCVKPRTVYYAWDKYGAEAEESIGKEAVINYMEWLRDNHAHDR